MKTKVPRLNFKDFKVETFTAKSNLYRQYYCKNVSLPKNWNLILKYYGKFPDPDNTEKWRLELWMGIPNKKININFENISLNPDNVIELYNINRNLIYKMYEGSFE